MTIDQLDEMVYLCELERNRARDVLDMAIGNTETTFSKQIRVRILVGDLRAAEEDLKFAIDLRDRNIAYDHKATQPT